VWLVRSPGRVSDCTFVPHLHYQLSKTCLRHIFSHVPTSLTNCFQKYEQRTLYNLYGTFVVTLAILLRLIDCHFIIFIIIIIIWATEKEERPGPGAYDYRPQSTITRQVTMGLPIRMPDNDGPPPNAYDINDGIGSSPRYKRSVPSWGLRSRPLYGSCYYSSIKAGNPGMSHCVTYRGGPKNGTFCTTFNFVKY